jgi:transposase
LQLTAEEREIATITCKLAPQLLDQPGVGPHAAAQLVLSWSHQGRITSEAAFARLAGTAPIPASSGQTIRYRLDRSGDRKLNRALHQILVTGKRTHPATIAYSTAASKKARHDAKQTAAPSATSPAASTTYSNTDRQRPLDFYRSITGAVERRRRESLTPRDRN